MALLSKLNSISNKRVTESIIRDREKSASDALELDAKNKKALSRLSDADKRIALQYSQCYFTHIYANRVLLLDSNASIIGEYPIVEPEDMVCIIRDARELALVDCLDKTNGTGKGFLFNYALPKYDVCHNCGREQPNLKTLNCPKCGNTYKAESD